MSGGVCAYDGVVGHGLALRYLVDVVVVCACDAERRGREQKPEAPRGVLPRHYGSSGVSARSPSRSRWSRRFASSRFFGGVCSWWCGAVPRALAELPKVASPGATGPGLSDASGEEKAEQSKQMSAHCAVSSSQRSGDWRSCGGGKGRKEKVEASDPARGHVSKLRFVFPDARV